MSDQIHPDGLLVDAPRATVPLDMKDAQLGQTWLVGAWFDGTDRTEEFIREGIWQHPSPSASALAKIRTMQPGDRIAIKSTFTQRYQLPFDGGGRRVMVNQIKARGIISRVGEDRVYVDWELIQPPRNWYLYTSPKALWRLTDRLQAEQLERFIFEDAEQDYDWFLARPYWQKVIGSPRPADPDKPGLGWIPFYEATADALLERREERHQLAELAREIRARHGQGTWHDKFADGSTGVLADIDPGTFMTIFNLGPTPAAKRHRMAQDVAQHLTLDLEAPNEFEGIPVTHPQNAWLFKWAKDRGDTIDLLWDVFAAGVRWADNPDDDEARRAFAEALPPALDATNWTLATALYRARPGWFCPMDGNTRKLLQDEVGISVPANAHAPGAAEKYLRLLDQLRAYLERPDSPVHTIPEFSIRAWAGPEEPDPEPETEAPSEPTEHPPVRTYTVDDLLAEGCFVPRQDLERILGLLRRTKNLILQGAPGTGKTWLAKRLGWILAGQRSSTAVNVVQFHPNTSYEDFVRGYRPTIGDDGITSLKLVDGPFLRLADTAHADARGNFTMIIEEINRGNPARALGEMLTLIEGSKRTPEDAIHLTYEPPGMEPEGVWLPDNLYTIGTMNVADRSLAMVDLALRRRFAFVTLGPALNAAWKQWLLDRTDDPQADAFADALANGVGSLNQRITDEPTLGVNFVIGHSFFTPGQAERIAWLRPWLEDQVESSVRPLLHEYWFDDRKTADSLADELLQSCP